MPWHETKDEDALKLIDKSGIHYLLFFASGDPPWCPDCREALEPLRAVFHPAKAPTLHVVRIGTREQWKTPANQWRKAPYHVNETPTLIKLVDGKETHRLGVDGCKSEKKLKELIEESGWCVIA